MTTGAGFALIFLIGVAVLVLMSIGGRAGMSTRDRWVMLGWRRERIYPGDREKGPERRRFPSAGNWASGRRMTDG